MLYTEEDKIRIGEGQCSSCHAIITTIDSVANGGLCWVCKTAKEQNDKTNGDNESD